MSASNEAGQRGLCDPRHVRGQQRGRPWTIRDTEDGSHERTNSGRGIITPIRDLEPGLSCQGARWPPAINHTLQCSHSDHIFIAAAGVWNTLKSPDWSLSNPIINPSKWPHYPHHKTIKQNPHGLRSLRVLIVANSSSIQYLGSQDSSYFSNVCFHHFLERVISYQELGWRETERIYQESDTGTNCQTHAATRSCLEIRWTRVNRKPVIDWPSVLKSGRVFNFNFLFLTLMIGARAELTTCCSFCNIPDDSRDSNVSPGLTGGCWLILIGKNWQPFVFRHKLQIIISQSLTSLSSNT